MHDHQHRHSEFSTDDSRQRTRGPSKSSAIFSRGRAGDVHLRHKMVKGEQLLTNQCISCGIENHVQPRRLFRIATPEWFVLGAAALWGAFLVVAAQAPDFLWYHSTSAVPLYKMLVMMCTNWSITLPFAFLAVVGTGALFFARAPYVSMCRPCNETQAKASRNLRIQVSVASILVVLSSYLLLTELHLPLIAGGAVVLPFGLLAIYWARTYRAADRLVFHPTTEGVVTVHGGPALREVLGRELPSALAETPTGRRWAAAAIAAVVFAVSVSFVAELTQDQLTCPPGTRMMDRETDFSTQKWCEAADGVAHGRYVSTSPSGRLEVIGGFNQGVPTGVWLDARSAFTSLVDEYSVHHNIQEFAHGFDGRTFSK